MPFKLYLTLILLFCISVSSAQISGKIVDASNQYPLEYATVALFDQGTQELVTGVITDLEGNFTLEEA